MKKTIKINSENLWSFINELATNERVKFKVYYDDNYVTEILWNGENFEWKSGLFTSEAFFNPLYDFEPINEEEFEDIKEIDTTGFGVDKSLTYDEVREHTANNIKLLADTIDKLIKNQKKIIERLKESE